MEHYTIKMDDIKYYYQTLQHWNSVTKNTNIQQSKNNCEHDSATGVQTTIPQSSALTIIPQSYPHLFWL